MKKISLIILTPIAIIVIAIVALLVFVDPNQFKPLIVEQTKKQTSLDLTIEGDVAWKFFPSIGFTLGKTQLSNPDGFSAPNMVKVDQVGLDISVLPLLSKELNVGNVTLIGAEVYIETQPDGRSNLDVFKSTAAEQSALASTASDSTAEVTNESTQESNPASPESEQPWSITLAGANIENAFLEIKDDQAKLYTKLENVNLQIANFEFGQWTTMSFSFSGVNNQQKFAIKGQADAKTNAELTDYQIKAVQVSGSFSQPDVNLSSFTVSLDEFKLASWANLAVAVKGNASGNDFDLNGSLKARLEENMKTFALQDVAMQTSLKGKDLDFESIKVGLNSFQFDQASGFDVAIKGTASGLNTDLTMSGQLLVDQAISLITVDDYKVNGSIKGDSLPQSPLALKVDSNIKFDLNKSQLSLVLKQLAANELLLDGTTSIELADIPKIRFQLHSPNINVDEWTGGSSSASSKASNSEASNSEASNSEASQGSTSKENSSGTSSKPTTSEPDLSVLKSVDVAGNIKIDKLVASNAKMQNAFADFSIKDGVFNLKSLTANLYQGSINAKGLVNGKQAVASYDFDASVKNVKVGALLKDVAANENLDGTGNIEINLTGKSLLPDELKKHLAGTVDVIFADGAFKGINVAHIIRTNYAKFKGETVPVDEVKQTDFSAMKGSVKLDKGTATLSKVDIQSPLLRISATGEANYLEQTLDVLAKTSVVGSLEGQGGKDIGDLKDLTLPLRAKGSWANPKFSLDLGALQKQELERHKKQLEEKARKETERGLKKLLGDKSSEEETKSLADSLLKKLF